MFRIFIYQDHFGGNCQKSYIYQKIKYLFGYLFSEYIDIISIIKILIKEKYVSFNT
jgi:hypothetical protein